MASGLSLIAFNAELQNFIDNEVPRRHKELQTDIVVKLHSLLAVSNFQMPHHPHDTGLAQGNWRVSVTEAKDDVIGSHEVPPPVRTEQQLRYQLRGMKGFQKVWIFNNVPYMPDLENGNSKMAPAGIMGPALTEIEVYLESTRGSK